MGYFSDLRELTRDLVWPPSPEYTEIDYPDLRGKVYVVTGGSAGIGFECARLLAFRGAKVYITGRTPAKIEAALASLNKVGQADLLPIYHEDLATVAPAVAALKQKETRLDGIVHNAGINYRGQNILEPYGVLDIIVINVLCCQLLQSQLLDLLVPGARTVWLSSAIHYYSPPQGGIDWDNMNEYDQGGYLGKGNGMYGQTKAMNIYQAILWGKRRPDVVSVAVHPGAIHSDIRRTNRWRGLVLGSLSKPTVWGAYQVLQVLIGPGVSPADNGAYFVPFGQQARVRPDVREAAEGAGGEKFWEWAQAKIAAFVPAPAAPAKAPAERPVADKKPLKKKSAKEAAKEAAKGAAKAAQRAPSAMAAAAPEKEDGLVVNAGDA